MITDICGLEADVDRRQYSLAEPGQKSKFLGIQKNLHLGIKEPH